MSRYIPLTAAATAGGGLLAAAFLHAAVAVAAPGDDAFTIGGTTFDPMTAAGPEGFDLVPALDASPPLLTLGGGLLSLFGGPLTALAPQTFDVYSGSGSSATELGSIDTGESVANLLGLPNTEFTVLDSTPLSGVDASQLPATGTVYDVLNLGNGTYNVYTAVPDVGSTSGTVTDTLVTPFGNINLDSLFGGINAANPLQPGDAFTGLQAGDSSVGADAFSLGTTTFDPMTAAGPEGFDPVTALAGVPPLLDLGGGTLFGDAGGDSPLTGFLALADQSFDVYSGTGSSATLLGSIDTGEDVTNLLGLTNTEFTGNGSTPATGVDPSALPTGGTVYDAFTFGGGYENVYIATPDVGSTSGTVTDTLVTPFGNINLDSLFGGVNAANALDAGAAFTGLEAGDSSIGAHGFSLGGFIFDPMTNLSPVTEGFNPIHPLLGAAPVLNLGGGTISLGGSALPIDTQDFDVCSGPGSSATDLGSITTGEDVTNLLGLTNTEFTVTDVTPTGDATTSDLPALGTTYDVLNFDGGWENVYIATPGADGTVADTLVTPFGTIDLDPLFPFDGAKPVD